VTLQLHDTMSRELVAVEPIQPGHVRMYPCGPTVWNRVHIGNFRTFIFEDVLRRWLDRRFAANVTHVMNLTDVDDRIIKNAVANGHTLDEETAQWITAFEEDRDTLGIRPAHHYPRATEYIEQMVDLIERLGRTGAAYRADGSYYFHIAAFPAYGRLSGANAEGLVSGASGRIDADDYTKEDVRDFALWKAVGPDEIGWDTRIGRGRPGWHIECSAMSMAYLGPSFDIHTGGVDLIFPHHQDEIAQSEAATGKTFVACWLHCAHLQMGGQKMAKSVGNIARVADVLEGGVSPRALRLALVSAHYRAPLSFGDDSLLAASSAVDRLDALFAALATYRSDCPDDTTLAGLLDGTKAAFEAALDDDLNISPALAALFDLVRELNRRIDARALSTADAARAAAFVRGLGGVLGIAPAAEASLEPESQKLLDERAAARTARDWAASDRLRVALAARGVLVEDTRDGQRWRRAD